MIQLNNAKAKALENYDTWGQWVIECYEDSELIEELNNFNSIEDWIKLRIDIASVYQEGIDTAW